MGTLHGCPQVGPSGRLHGLVAGVPGVQHRRENEGVWKLHYATIILSTMPSYGCALILIIGIYSPFLHMRNKGL